VGQLINSVSVGMEPGRGDFRQVPLGENFARGALSGVSADEGLASAGGGVGATQRRKRASASHVGLVEVFNELVRRRFLGHDGGTGVRFVELRASAGAGGRRAALLLNEIERAAGHVVGLTSHGRLREISGDHGVFCLFLFDFFESLKKTFFCVLSLFVLFLVA